MSLPIILIVVLMLIVFSGVVYFFGKGGGDFSQDSVVDNGEGAEVQENLSTQRDVIIKEKSRLMRESDRIFALYEMTKELSKTLNETEAFSSFKNKLKENVEFEECWFVDELTEEMKVLEEREDTFTYDLKSKGRVLGVLVFSAVPEKEREKVSILAQQFVLALSRIRLYQQVEQLSITDSLTQVQTRRYFMDRFEEEMLRAEEQNKPLSLLMVDVDHFKSFNDGYGHLVGDQILREMGAILKDTMREIDFVGRYGGEEFCVVLTDTDAEGAYNAAERIRQKVEETKIQTYEAVVNATVSVGASTFPKDAVRADDLVDKADRALYEAKKEGRNRACSFS